MWRQTETVDGGKWVTLQRVSVEENGMGKYIRAERAIWRKDGRGCWGEIIK